MGDSPAWPGGLCTHRPYQGSGLMQGRRMPKAVGPTGDAIRQAAGCQHVSASLFQRKGEDCNNMEQISIIERFPYPFQVSPHCTLCGSTLTAEEDQRGTGCQTQHHCPHVRHHSPIWGHPAAVRAAQGRQVSHCEPQGVGQFYLRGLLRCKPASELYCASFGPMAHAGGMLSAGCPLSSQPSCLPLLDTLKVREGSGKSQGKGLI